MDKILVVCERGNVRSVTCAAILKDYLGLTDVIAVGYRTTTPETMRMLCDWAQLVLVVGQPWIKAELPDASDPNILVVDIGEDRWGQAMHPDLVRAVIDALWGDTALFKVCEPPPVWTSLAQYLEAAEAVFRSAQRSE